MRIKKKDKDKVKRILFITLSNIGDIVLTTPVLGVLKREFPEAKIDVISGPNGSEIFSGHPFVWSLIVYDKFANIESKKQLIKNLRRNKYDLIVDLRNSLFPFLIGSKYRNSIMPSVPFRNKHKKEEHLWKLKALGLDIQDAEFSFHFDQKDKELVKRMLAENNVDKEFVIISPGAKSHIKRWTKQGFVLVADRIIGELNMDVVMIGDKMDKEIVREITSLMNNRPVDFTSKLTLRQLGALIGRARLLVTNDSAPMHIASALGIDIIAIFGPTDPAKYGPRGKENSVMRQDLTCSPCELAQCVKDHDCMELVRADDVFKEVKRILSK